MRVLFLLTMLVATTLLAFGLAALRLPDGAAAQPAQPEVAQDTVSTTANCRYGVVPLGDTVSWVETLGAGWYFDFGATPPATPPGNGAEFVHGVRVHQDKTQSGQYLPTYAISPGWFNVRLAVEDNPGARWLVGNEPDRGPNPGEIVGGQDDTYPDVYATAYHDVYHFIKTIDPTAQIANAALVEITPGRLQYLDMVWDAYLDQYGVPMPVDFWNMHLYILPEANSQGQPNGVANVALGTDPALAIRGAGGKASRCGNPNNAYYCFADHDHMATFLDQVVSMRQWMKDHGQQEKPLIISEYSLLYPYTDDGGTCFLQDEYGKCFTPQRVKNFMLASFSNLENSKDPALGHPFDDDRLVQQWLWFSTFFDGAGVVSNLLDDPSGPLSSIGQTFQNHVTGIAPSVNLHPVRVASPSAQSQPPSGTATVTLSAQVINNGNTGSTAPFTVTFYADAALSQVIGSDSITEVVGGCALRQAPAQVTWSDLGPGLHRYWVKVDDANAIAEGDEDDNVASGVVFVDLEQMAVPFFTRP